MAYEVTQAPQLETLTRRPDGSLGFTWTNVVDSTATYSNIQVGARVVGSGTWTGVNTLGYPTISSQSYAQYTKPGGGGFLPGVAYELALRAYGPLGWSVWSNARSVAAMETPTAQFDSVSRISATVARVILGAVNDPPATTTVIYAYIRPVGTGRWTQANRTTQAGQTVLDLPKLNGATAYEVELRAYGPAGWADPTAAKTVEAWFEIPPGVTNLLADRDPATGATTLTWGGSGTARGEWLTHRIYRAPSGGAQQPVLIDTIPGADRDYVDVTAAPERGYIYTVAPVSALGEATQQASVTVAATVNVPNAPSNLTVAYGGGNGITATWTRNSVAGKVYTSQQVWWRDAGSDDDWTVVPIGATAYQQTIGVGANRVVEVAVVAVNAAGLSELSNIAGPVATIPAPPVSVTAGWYSGSAINVTITLGGTTADEVEVEFTTNGTVWYPAATLPVQPVVTWSHEDLTAAVPHTYRARTLPPVAGTTPPSAWVESAVVGALTTPAPPTITLTGQIDATGPIPVTVGHQPLDGTGQTAGELRHRVGTGAWTTINLGASSTATIPAGTYSNGATLQLEAWTAGATGDPSGTSTASVVLRPRPVAAWVDESSIVYGDHVVIAWTAAQQTSALVELLNDSGVPIWSRTVDADTRQVTVDGLQDQTAYARRVTIRDAYQPATPIVAPFTVQLDRPTAPALTATVNPDTMQVHLTVTGHDAVSATVWRTRNPDGTGWEQVGDVDGDWTYTDRFAPLATVTYKVRSYSSAGGWADSQPVTVALTSCDFWLHWGPGYGNVCRAGLDPSNVLRLGRRVILNRYVGDEDGPQPTFGDLDDYTVQVSFTVDEGTGDSPLHQWEAAAQYPGPVMWRDPAGRVMRAAAHSWSVDDSASDSRSVAFTLTRVGGGAL